MKRILIIPGWYKTKKNPNRGIFFFEQAKLLANQCKIVIVGINKSGKRFKVNKNQLGRLVEINIIIPNILNQNFGIILNIVNKIILIILVAYIIFLYRINIIHLQSHRFGYIALFFRKFNIPFIVTEHSSAFYFKIYNKYQLSKIRKIYSKASVRIAVSEKFCDLLEKTFNLKFEYIPNFIDEDEFYKKDKIVDKKNYIILSIGHLNQNKNYNLLIESVNLIKDDSIVLKICGDGIDRKHLEGIIKNYNLNNRIDLLGNVDRGEIRQLLNECDMLAITSEYETFSIVAIEALAMGKPVLSTFCQGPESIINNDVGILVDSTPEIYAEGIIRMKEQNWNAEKIRYHFLSNFSSEVIGSQILDVYMKINNR